MMSIDLLGRLLPSQISSTKEITQILVNKIQEKWSINNCAEVRAINEMLVNLNTELTDLAAYTLEIDRETPKHTCKNHSYSQD
jgi:hypothetical protein